MKPQQRGRLAWRPSDWPNNREDRRRGEAGSIGLAQQQRRQNETPDEKQARLEAVRLAQHKRRDISIATTLFQQNAVESRILNFYSKLASLGFRECTRYRIIVEFEFEFGVRVRSSRWRSPLALHTCAIATCACVSPVRQELGFW